MDVCIEAHSPQLALDQLGAALSKLASQKIPEKAQTPARNNWERLREPHDPAEKARLIASEWIDAYFPDLLASRREILKESLSGIIEGAMKSIEDSV